jgi:2-C-methyl-D-erythritol 4-phosphate cytidylyltransferase
MIVVNANYTDLLQSIIKDYKYGKIKNIIEGGAYRFNSCLNAILFYENKYPNCNLIFHDAARPFVSEELISNTIDKLQYYNAVNTAIDATDIIIEKNLTDNTIANIPNRSAIAHSQTPQGFYLPTILKAYNNGLKDVNFNPTDDCSVVCKYLPEERIAIITGDVNNIKNYEYNEKFKKQSHKEAKPYYYGGFSQNLVCL